MKNKNNDFIYVLSGIVFILAIWFAGSSIINNESLFPNPLTLPEAFKSLVEEDKLFYNIWYSVKLNMLGFLEAVLICVPLGYGISLCEPLKKAFSKILNSFRFIPLTAMTGLFVIWFGIQTNMKVQFLAFGISVYLLPVIIERVSNFDSVYTDTLKTLGANRLQIIYHGYFKGCMFVIYDDIRVLTAISWTYIIIVELINKNGGLGSLIYLSQRFGRPDKIFALLITIITLGLLQDLLFKVLGKLIFPFTKEKH